MNFGGLKYRAELQSKVPGVKPFQYDEGRGEDDKVYFKSDSIETFIKLYWAFIERSPYKGWRDAADKSPAEYLKHIVYAGYVGGAQAHRDWYIQTVLSLMDEVGKEFKQVEQGGSTMPVKYSLKGVRIAFDCGHGYDKDVVAFDPGAVGNSCREADMVQIYADIAATELKKLGAEVTVFKYIDPKAQRYSLGEKGARSKGYDFFVSCHLNAFNGSAQGTEVLYYSDKFPADKAFAQSILESLVASLKLTNRGVKTAHLGVLSQIDMSLKGACLIEPFFIDASSNGGQHGVKEMCIKVGYALAEGIAVHCKKIGLAKAVSENDPGTVGTDPGTIPVPPVEVPKETSAPKTTFKPFYLLKKDQLQTEGEYAGLWRMKLTLVTPEGESQPFYCRSGARGAQLFHTGPYSKQGSLEPLPQGHYKVGSEDWGTDLKTTNKRDNYEGSLGEGLGPVVWALLPQFKTERGNLLIHLDSNYKTSPGTAGCIGLSGLAILKEWVAFKRKNPTVSDLYVDWGLGNLDLPNKGYVKPEAKAEPVKPKEEVKPVPVQDTPIAVPAKKSWWRILLEIISKAFSSAKK